jgi:hypothetical protein
MNRPPTLVIRISEESLGEGSQIEQDSPIDFLEPGAQSRLGSFLLYTQADYYDSKYEELLVKVEFNHEVPL